MDRTYRVVQWATGNIGTRALRQVVRAPHLDLAGVLVYDEAKAGVDAGELCGEAATGIRATTDRQAVIDLAADCVLYMPRFFDVDDVVALLERGTNVITTRSELFDGGSPLDPGARQRILQACEAGGASAYATGSSPGFISEALPLALLSLQREVERVEIEEYADMSRRNSPELLFGIMGFANTPESFDPRRSAHLLGSFSPSLRTIAEAVGWQIDDWSVSGEVAVAARTTRIAAGEIPAGRVAAQRTRIAGSAGGSEVVTFTASWYCSADVEPAWDLRPTGWRVHVRGDAPMSVDLPFPVVDDDLGAVTPSYTANRPVNAVPFVCEAPAGILRTTDLPVVVPAGPSPPARRLSAPET